MRTEWLLGLMGLAGVGACGPEEPPDVACERQPPYRLEVTAFGGALPGSTVVHVKHGGGEVDYALADPPTESELVFCDPAPAAGRGVAALDCDLWTQGAVTILVEAGGYVPAEVRAALEWEAGCVVTQKIEVELVPAMD